MNDGALAACDVKDFLTAAAGPRLAGVNDGDSTFSDFLDLLLVSIACSWDDAKVACLRTRHVRILLVLVLIISFILFM